MGHLSPVGEGRLHGRQHEEVATGLSSPRGGGTHTRSRALGHSDGIVVPLWGKDTSTISSFRT
jgi:hypothetical protein